MDNETYNAVSAVVETLTSIGILLLWVRAERHDNESLFAIIQALTSLRLRQIEHEEDDKFIIKKPPGSYKENQ